jgi:AcrR family transcriptional regulator
LLLKTSEHKQERAFATRKDLMAAARTIFATQGFESTRIEDIAARAGKTRGAFYANFADKEDVFFAIFEEDVMRGQEEMIAGLSAAASVDERIEILAQHLAGYLRDRQRVLLNLEFKMYVIRHHRKRKRLNEIYSDVSQRCAMHKISSLAPGATAGQRHRLITEFGAVIDGLALNALFNPEGMSCEQIVNVLRIAAAEVLATEPEHP